MLTTNQFDRLNEIREEMRVLLEEADHLIRQSSRHIYDRARAYPLGHLDAALDHVGFTANKYDVTLQDIIDEADPGEEEEEVDEDESPDDSDKEDE